MSITLGAIKTSVNDIRVDGTAATVDIDAEGLRAINYIVSDLQNAHDWEGCIEESTIRYFPLKKGYTLPSDFKALISLLPQLNGIDDFKMKTPTVFKKRVRGGEVDCTCSIEEGKYKRLLMHYPYTRAQQVTLLTNAAYDTNGSWVVGDDASAVRTDTDQFTENHGSVAFDVVVATSVNNYSTLTKAMTDPVDLTNFRNGTVFVNVDVPTSMSIMAYLTSFDIRVGSSASDYYTINVTTRADGTSFAQGINQLGFDLETATITGSPNIAAIDYVLFKMNYNASLTDKRAFRIGEMVVSNYEPIVLQYYNNKLVNDVSASVGLSRFDGTDASDTVLLPEDADIVLMSGTAWRLLEQMEEPEKANSEHNWYVDRKNKLIEHYPSRRKKVGLPTLSLGYSRPWL